MKLLRRDFLTASLGLPLLWFAPVTSLARAAQPTASGVSPLVVVFLRGGCDGLSLIAPVSDPAYQGARDSLAVRDSGQEAGIPIAQEWVREVDFRFHPAASGLSELYQSKHMAIVHAVGLADGTRSHF